MKFNMNGCFITRPFKSAVWAGLGLIISPTMYVNAAEIEAGSLQQQIDRNQTFKLPRQATPLLPKPLASKPDAGMKIFIKTFKLQGNSLLTEQEIQDFLKAYQNIEMSFSDIENVAIELADLFRKAGWTVKAYLPEQDVKDGIVLIQVVEARLGRVVIDGVVPPPATAESLSLIIQARQAAGDYLNGNAIDRAILIANDISGVYITGNLAEGVAESETDLILKASSKPFKDGNLTLDNTGSKGTGTSRFALNLNLNNVIQNGDQLTGNTIQTEASQYTRLGWKVPIGPDGWTLGASTSKMNYRALQFQETVAPTGSSGTNGLEGVYPLVRTRSKNVYVSFALEDKHFLNFSEGQIKSDYSSRLKTVSFYGNSFDEFAGGGANTGSLAFVKGFLDLDRSPNASEIATTTQTAGVFNKIRYALNRQQVINTELSLIASLSGQVSRSGKNLDSSEKFYLGGSSGIRAYPSSEAGGGKGVLGSLELRWQFAPDISFSTFSDTGRVVMYPSKNLQDVNALNAYSLRGKGLSMTWQADEGVTLKLILARRIGENPNANIETGKDLDGSLIRNRAWIALNIPF